MISGAEYLAAIVATANLFYTAWDLGRRTVVSFNCPGSYLPLYWSMAPMAIHEIAAIAFYLTPISKRLRQVREGVGESPKARDKEGGKAKITSRIAEWLRCETQLCAHTTQASREAKISPLDSRISKHTVAPAALASLIACIHVFAGTTIFSSLGFISLNNALPRVVRYFASAAICHVMLGFEFTSLREPSSLA